MNNFNLFMLTAILATGGCGQQSQKLSTPSQSWVNRAVIYEFLNDGSYITFDLKHSFGVNHRYYSDPDQPTKLSEYATDLYIEPREQLEDETTYIDVKYSLGSNCYEIALFEQDILFNPELSSRYILSFVENDVRIEAEEYVRTTYDMVIDEEGQLKTTNPRHDSIFKNRLKVFSKNIGITDKVQAKAYRLTDFIASYAKLHPTQLKRIQESYEQCR